MAPSGRPHPRMRPRLTFAPRRPQGDELDHVGGLPARGRTPRSSSRAFAGEAAEPAAVAATARAVEAAGFDLLAYTDHPARRPGCKPVATPPSTTSPRCASSRRSPRGCASGFVRTPTDALQATTMSSCPCCRSDSSAQAPTSGSAAMLPSGPSPSRGWGSSSSTKASAWPRTRASCFVTASPDGAPRSQQVRTCGRSWRCSVV